MARKKKMWIIVGIIASILIITVIVVPTSVVLTKKTKATATTTQLANVQKITINKISPTKTGL